MSNHPVDQFLTAVDAGRLELSTGRASARITPDTMVCGGRWPVALLAETAEMAASGND